MKDFVYHIPTASVTFGVTLDKTFEFDRASEGFLTFSSLLIFNVSLFVAGGGEGGGGGRSYNVSLLKDTQKLLIMIEGRL